jgi:hypothetical protein
MVPEQLTYINQEDILKDLQFLTCGVLGSGQESSFFSLTFKI